MSYSKEFTGKTLDDAIQEACAHFQLERSGLEIDIISGGSSGIFGLVGKKPAIVRARPLHSGSLMADAARERRREESAPAPARPAMDDFAAPRAAWNYDPDDDDEPVAPVYSAPADSPVAGLAEPAPAPEPEDEQPLEDKELESFILMAAGRLVEPIIGPTPMTVTQTKDRLRVHLQDTSDSGLLIGRDGQTLNAVQYLLNRMVGKRWPDAARVQVDTGDYRHRQDDKLRSIALALARRAAASGKVQSTKPLSSYHRRVIHLALQNDQSVTTKSKGDGPLKRVLILPRRARAREA